MEKNSSLYNRVKVVKLVKVVKVVEVVKPLNFNHFNYCFYRVKLLRSPITKHNTGSLTSLTSLTDIVIKPDQTKPRLREVNTYNGLPGLFSGALTLYYNIALFCRPLKALALRLLQLNLYTQMKRKALETVFSWSK